MLSSLVNVLQMMLVIAGIVVLAVVIFFLVFIGTAIIHGILSRGEKDVRH